MLLPENYFNFYSKVCTHHKYMMWRFLSPLQYGAETEVSLGEVLLCFQHVHKFFVVWIVFFCHKLRKIIFSEDIETVFLQQFGPQWLKDVAVHDVLYSPWDVLGISFPRPWYLDWDSLWHPWFSLIYKCFFTFNIILRNDMSWALRERNINIPLK